MDSDLFMVFWILGCMALPFWPAQALCYFALLVVAAFVPAQWFFRD